MGEVGERPVLGGRFGADVPLGEDDQVGGERGVPALQAHLLRALRGPVTEVAVVRCHSTVTDAGSSVSTRRNTQSR